MPITADVEPEEIEAIFKVDDACLVLVETQSPRGQPRGKSRLDLFGLLPGMTADGQIVGIPHQDWGARDRGTDITAGAVITDSRGLLQTMQRHIHQQRADDSSNAVGNFCFEVSLSYRRVELPRRVSAAV